MAKYVLQRLIFGLLTIYFIATATFFAMHFVPGDPISGAKALRPEIRANLERKYGLDQPLMTQYRVYLFNMMKGDFGISYTQQNRSVNDIILNHFPVSAILGILAVFNAALGGVFFGALTALFRGRLADRYTVFFVILFVSVPNFVFAALSQYYLTELNQFLRHIHQR